MKSWPVALCAAALVALAVFIHAHSRAPAPTPTPERSKPGNESIATPNKITAVAKAPDPIASVLCLETK